ncbi:TetR/AcrR family transcriptional regulator [Massilia sp. TN1-12]|uniref:TetR/AcrR family transcriptional regulator n=1 Tax=Massilia paldalensis TaxID=3377675 RepID=UPI00384B5936
MGRHREFDVDEALDAVVDVFWSKGYEGASYTDLTRAAGVERPGLYAAFGNKEAMFRLALDRYYQRYLSYFPEALEQPTSRRVVDRILRGAAELHTRYPERRGCLGVLGAVVGSDDTVPVQQTLIAARAAGESALVARLERARQEGDLPDDAHCAALAAFVMTMLSGMAVEARNGADRATLDAVAEQALSTWPGRG